MSHPGHMSHKGHVIWPDMFGNTDGGRGSYTRIKCSKKCFTRTRTPGSIIVFLQPRVKTVFKDFLWSFMVLSPNPLIFLLFHLFWLYLIPPSKGLGREEGSGKSFGSIGRIWSGLGPDGVRFWIRSGHGGLDSVISEVKINIVQNQKTD